MRVLNRGLSSSRVHQPFGGWEMKGSSSQQINPCPKKLLDGFRAGAAGQCLAPGPPGPPEKGAQGLKQRPGSQLSRGALSRGEGDPACDHRAYSGCFHVTGKREARGPACEMLKPKRAETKLCRNNAVFSRDQNPGI